MRIGLNTSIVGGSLINPFAAYNIGGQTPQTIADFEADKYASASKNLGPELVTNGTFDSDLSGWTDASNGTALVEWVDGKASLDDSQGGSAVGKPKLKQTVTGNGVFLLTFETEADSIFIIQNETDGYFFSSTSGTSRSVVVLSQTTSWSLSFQLENPNVARTIDNVSLREIVSYSPASATASSLLTHTRAGTATYTDNTGTLQTAASGELRTDNHIWNGSSWVKRCLVEPQSTNLVTYSEDFTDASWGKTGVTVSGNTLTATTSSSNLINKDPGYTSSTQYTAWAVVEDVNAGFAYVSAFDGVDNFGAMFDLSDGSFVGYRTGTTNDNNWVQDLGGGKYLIGVTFTTSAASASSFGFGVGLSTNGSLGFASPTNGQQIIVHRTQVEASSVPTSYIPTTSAQVTRPADALSIDSTLLPYDSTAMTIAMEGEMTYADNDDPFESILFLWESDPNNYLYVRLRTNLGSGQIQFRQIASGVSDNVENDGSYFSPGVNVPFNIASRHTSSDLNGAVDGTALTANTTVTALPDLSATDFEIAPTGVINIKSLRILGGYGATDAELEAATT